MSWEPFLGVELGSDMVRLEEAAMGDGGAPCRGRRPGRHVQEVEVAGCAHVQSRSVRRGGTRLTPWFWT